MRWDSLFEDLEAQLQEQLAAQLREEVAENIRIERATEQLKDRLHGLHGYALRFGLAGDVEVDGRLGPQGAGYLCIESETERWLVQLASVERITIPLGTRPHRHSVVASSPVKFTAVLRGLLRDRSRVQVTGRTGAPLAEGTLGQVGKDFVVVCTHARDEYVRSRDVTAQVLIPVAAIGWVTVRDSG